MLVTTPAASVARFEAVPQCWVCGGRALERYYRCRMDFTEYATQDPELFAYTGEGVWFVQCGACGFGQPEALPTLPGYFEPGRSPSFQCYSCHHGSVTPER